MNPTTLDNLYDELSSVYENLNAEVLIAEIQENSHLGIDDFVISNKGTFSRSYRRDVINIDNVLHDDKLTLNLSRNGLYDSLPEGLFHAPYVGKVDETYTDRRKVMKEEEQATRQFFAPIESEFFFQRLKIEENERDSLNNFYSLKDDFLISFWNLDLSIPRPYMLKLIKLLPHCHKIVGNLETIRMCLERILDEKVEFKLKHINRVSETIEQKHGFSNCDFQLGVNSILDGPEYEILEPLLEVNIGPVLQNRAGQYLNSKGFSTFIDTFYGYLLPMEIESKTNIIMNEDPGFILNESLEPIMGISTYL